MKWHQALTAYKSYLKIERGLSKNTLQNYGLDIQKLVRWCDENTLSCTPITITETEVQQFIYEVSKTMNPRCPKPYYLWITRVFYLPHI